MEGVIEGPGKKRRRPKVSCVSCRRRKIRCNRARPCNNCLRFRTAACVYEDGDSPQSKPRQYPTPDSQGPPSSARSHPESSLTTSSLDVFNLTSDRSALDAEATRLKSRIKQLEDQLVNANLEPVQGSYEDIQIRTTDSRVSGPLHLHYKKDGAADNELIANGLSMKGRMFGQSHWAVSIAEQLRDFFITFEPYVRQWPSDYWLGLERCKCVARRIKARRAISWPLPLISKLPPRIVCDALVDQYLCTTESLTRILHIPTFCKEYEEFWVSEADKDFSFVIQLKLVLAIGAVTYDDHFSLRSSAIQWVHEAQIWISGPKHKGRLNIQAMQTNLLLLLAQERVGVDGDPTWVSAGALLRKAMYMGLHRDPRHLPQRKVFAAEMHRRLWTTIVEINLQSSLTYGGSPLLSLNDFDTALPSNFDDEQLEAEDPVPKPEGELTQMSFTIAYRRTLPQRLAVIRHLNDLASPAAYKETLQLDAELRAAYRELGKTLRECTSASSSSSFQHETLLIDFLMQRYFSALHTPYFGPAHGKAYAFSQKTAVESSLRLWRAANQQPPGQSSNGPSSSDDDLSRLTTCSSGLYQTATMHAAFVISVELRAQLQEGSLYPAPLRPDLVAVLEEVKPWCLKVITAGATSVKGYLLMSLIIAQFQGMMRGMDNEQIADLLAEATANVEKDCMPILERVAAAEEQETEAEVDASDTTPPDISGNWGSATSDVLLTLYDLDPMSWMFTDELDSGVNLL
ncbi:hypothetical protein BDV06DRAFT_233450 [Aspergillus oleicola]